MAIEGVVLYILPDGKWVVAMGPDPYEDVMQHFKSIMPKAYEDHQAGKVVIFPGYVRVVHA